MRLYFVIACLLGGSLVVGCGSGSGQTPPTLTGGEPSPFPTRLLPELWLSLNAPLQVKAGEAVTLELTLTNQTGRHLTFFMPDPYPHQFVVETPNGTPLWSLTFDKVIAGMEVTRSLAPDESLTFRELWDLTDNNGIPLPPGNYFVRGSLRLEYPFKMETGQGLTITP